MMIVRNHMWRSSSSGWTVVELLAVIGIVAMLTGLVLPSIQSIRESARRTACLNKSRQLGLACFNFESVRQSLPPGTLGFPDTVEIVGINDLPWLNPNHTGFWKNSQHTSWLTFLLPFLDETVVNDRLPPVLLAEKSNYAMFRATNPSAPVWIGNLQEVDKLKQSKIQVFLCPSDALDSAEFLGALAIVATQPCFDIRSGDDFFLPSFSTGELHQPAGTNFLGNCGAHSAGESRVERPREYVGPFGSRTKTQYSQLRDGSSNTILLGENIGAISDSKRSLFHSWMFGGLARGRGGLPWLSDINPIEPGYLLLGDNSWSYPAGFGSMHPSHVNFVFADGSVHSLSRLIALQTFYNLCGIEDGGISD
jgi:prepilin-type processing-associated H-X9-DG protein